MGRDAMQSRVGVRDLLRSMREDVAAVRVYDPSLTSNVQVVLTSAGAHAVWTYRLSHRAWRSGHRLAAQLLRYGARVLTGVEIHPGAMIGRRLVIDHGTGVVIGETAVVGNDVILHHGVTLGGRVNTPGKRHPSLGDRVYIGAGALVLGAVMLGDDCRVGAGAVVLGDVPAGATVAGVPARVVGGRRDDGGDLGDGLSPSTAGGGV